MISMDKQYRTNGGCAARIFALDGGGKYPVLGAYLDYAGEWCCARWTANGRLHCDRCDDDMDLIEVKPKITRTYWLVHGAHNARAFQSEEHARNQVGGGIAITGPHTVEFCEGDGL